MNPASLEPFGSYVSNSDVRLMLDSKRGDEAAFSKLVERYSDSVVNYFYFQGGDHELAEDCAQEVWVKIFRSRQDYEPRARFSTYLFRVARNHWIDQYRSRVRRPAEASLSQEIFDEGTGGALADRIAAPGDDPTQAVQARELARIVATALARLPDEMREVYVLGEVEGRPYSEISEILDVPVGTVKSRMFHAVRRLRELLKHRVEGLR